tara:strand:+ start:122 stop:271 length:150 start_codon:yes stop_codon:yes gene_type:complete
MITLPLAEILNLFFAELLVFSLWHNGAVYTKIGNILQLVLFFIIKVELP